jgi:hypothetical protein
MDAFENGLELKPSHTIGNDRGEEKINKFGPMKLNVGYFFLWPCKSKLQYKNLQFLNSKSYPIHLSFCASSFPLLGGCYFMSM